MPNQTSKDKLSVALVNLHWPSERMGGGEKAAQEIVDLLTPHIDFHVISGYYKNMPTINPNQKTFKYIFGDTLLKFFQFKIFGKIILAKLPVDVTHGKYMTGPIKHPYILEIHQPFFAENDSWLMNSVIYRAIQRHALRNADAILVHSNMIKRWLITHRQVNPFKIHVIPYGKNPERYKESRSDREVFRSSHGIRENKIVFLYPGRITPLKNQDMLFAAFEKLPHSLRDTAYFIISGIEEDADYLAKLQEAAKKYPHNFYVTTKHESILKYYSSCDWVISTSEHAETFGQILIEAMAMGRPLLLPRTEIFEEVAQDAALYFKPGNAEALAGSIGSILQTPSIGNTLQTKGQNLFNRRYSMSAYKRNILELYEQVRI